MDDLKLIEEEVEAKVNSLKDGYEDNLERSREEAKKFGEDDWRKLRILAKTDLFFLAYTILGYDKLSVNLHGNLCEYIKKTEGERFREFLLPRGHYKSTILTIAHSIQVALPDDLGTAQWPLSLGTNSRILIAHETHESAMRFLASITGHFLGNPFLMALFPECIPNPRKHRINKAELELPRKQIWSEPTFDTLGVGGRAQGRHYNKLKLDDLIGKQARDSKTEMRSCIEWFDNIQSLFSTFRLDTLDLIGTRWSFDDLYAHAEEVYGPKLKVYSRKVEEIVTRVKEGKEIKVKESIFPEEFPTEALVTIRKNKKVWNAQYLNDPNEGEGGFQDSWLRYYYWLDKSRIAYFSGIDKQKTEISTHEMNKYILIDPAMTGLWGFTVVGVDSKGKVFVLEAIKDDKDPTYVVDLMFQKVMQWQPRCVAIEKVLFSGLFQPWLVTEMSMRKIKFKVEAISTRGEDKDGRILGLVHFWKNGQIFVNENQLDLLEEYRKFGFTSNIHLMDSLAQGPKVPWKPFYGNFGTGLVGSNGSNGNVSKIDKLTGYSPILMTRGNGK